MKELAILLQEFIPTWYLVCGALYGGFMMLLAIRRDAFLVMELVIRVFVNTIIVPVILGLLWPISLIMHIAAHVLDLRRNWFFRQLYGPDDE